MAKMLAEAQRTEIDGAVFLVPAVTHLIAMKLHAMKHNAERRHARDLPDIVGLVQVNRLDVRTDDFRALCRKFGTPELYDEIVKAVS